jgi:hypothetical protein
VAHGEESFYDHDPHDDEDHQDDTAFQQGKLRISAYFGCLAPLEAEA